MFERRRMIGFAVVGGIGFAVDGGVLYLSLSSLGPYWGRGVSFAVAVVVTWLLNRFITFRDRRNRGWGAELARYVGTQSLGALANLAIYAACIAASAYLAARPILALAIGAGGGLLANYVMARCLVFRRTIVGKGV